MNTTLNADGKIGLPEQIVQADHLAAGDPFDVTRLRAGQYLLTLKKPSVAPGCYKIIQGKHGFPVIKGDGGVITSEMIKEIEGITP
jgi:hypothetical protein